MSKQGERLEMEQRKLVGAPEKVFFQNSKNHIEIEINEVSWKNM